MGRVSSPKSKTRDLVVQLIGADQDHEWYPTTEAMIQAVKRWMPENATSIMDIGAGDGRVLASFAKKCENAKLYSIEISPILRQAHPENIVPVGTDLFEQRLASLQVDYIFCNPRYSQYEDWVCKIVSEGFAKKAFLVIPQRWKDSNVIQETIKKRGATTRVIFHDDFSNGDRAARAIIDIVEVTFPLDRWDRDVKDPFEIWFDQNIDTFDKEKEFKESETGEELAKRLSDSTIDEMVESYLTEYRLLEANYRAIFKLDYAILKELGIEKDAVREGLKKKMQGLKTKYWQVLFDRMDALTSRLATKAKKKLLDKLTHNASVEFTASNAYAVVIWAIKNANQYFDEQLVDLFYDLSYRDNAHNYVSNQKTWEQDGWRYMNHGRKNTHYALDYRIVIPGSSAMSRDTWKWDYPGGLYRGCHELIADVIAVMGNLGFSTHGRSWNRQWQAGQWQNFYLTNSNDILFQVKAYMNGNLHFRFNQEAIKALNINAARLLKWVRTADEVVQEMGYTLKEAKMYFNRNTHILPDSVKLLSA